MTKLDKRYAMDLQPFQKPLPQDFKYVIYYCYAVRLGAPLTPADCCFKGKFAKVGILIVPDSKGRYN